MSPARPLRIALFSEVYWPMVSGVALTLLRTAEELMRRGHAVKVFSATYPLPEGAQERPEVHRSPSRALFLSKEVQWAFPEQAEIDAELAAFRPDVVHLLTEFPIGIAGLRAARKLGVPIVASAHTDYERYAERYGMRWAVKAGWHYLRWFYNHAQVVLAPSQAYERHLQLRGVRHTGRWSRGVHADRFSPAFRSEAWRASLGVAPAQPLVLSVGRLAPEKGIPQLLDAWERLRAWERWDARLVFVGDGSMAESIRERALPGVSLAGTLRDRALSEAYASGDLFVFPSVTETFGNVLLEAMASGLPSIAATEGGQLDFARHGENAWLVDAEAPATIAEGIATLLDDAPLRARLAAAARATALSRSWDEVFDGLVARYRAAVTERDRVAA